MKLLVSVRSVLEARLAAQHGADLIDLKEPALGALGALPVERVREIVAALRADGVRLPISATIGDWPAAAPDAIDAAVAAVAAAGVDVVKVGVERSARARALLDRLARFGAGIVPVFIADQGLDPVAVDHAAALGFAALMVDTADKRAGSLFDVAEPAVLRRFKASAHAGGALCGVAGALRAAHAPLLRELDPDFAGFRTAVCAVDRRGALDAGRLRELRLALHAAAG